MQGVCLMIAWMVVVCGTSCPPGLLPDSFWNFTEYIEESQELRLVLPPQVPGDLWSCLEALEGDNSTRLEVRLVPAAVGRQDCTGLHTCGGKVVGCCSSCSSQVSEQVVELATLRSWADPRPFTFKYVGGSYALQLASLPCPACNMTSSWCSAAATLGATRRTDACLEERASLVSMERSGSREHCVVHYTLAAPLCTAVLPYSTVTVTALTSESNETCEEASAVYRSTRVTVSPCTPGTCGNRSTSPSLARIHYTLEATPNSSYCLWLVPDSPHCRQQECGLPLHSPPLACEDDDLRRAPHLSLPVTQPIFIALVCSVLAVCLLALLWVVVKCSRDQGSPSCSPEPDMKKEIGSGGMPRSLTIDEMEHICRLRHQEIVLVYFPDTEKFKTLNRLFKDWLQSLNILNVNHVTDIYDEKYTDGSDNVLKNPEAWVSGLLSDPERRVVLVTSRLAYETLLHIRSVASSLFGPDLAIFLVSLKTRFRRKGLAPPQLAGDDPHGPLLAAMLRTLDSDLFRGNYRRLICVRYEDLKICDRRYGSESFNIVPGTEYLLPQHLEDVARWIHPVEARPGLWAEHRPQVRSLLECIKGYRHHEVRGAGHSGPAQLYNFKVRYS